MIKYFVFLLILIGIVNVTIPNVSAVCAAGTLEWWESCNDTSVAYYCHGQREECDLINNTKLNIIILVAIVAAEILVFIVWRKKMKKRHYIAMPLAGITALSVIILLSFHPGVFCNCWF